jgi:hypothetical protein
MPGVYFTHPVVASLDHPLFAARKEGFAICFLHPLCEAERGDQRSAVGVS